MSSFDLSDLPVNDMAQTILIFRCAELHDFNLQEDRDFIGLCHWGESKQVIERGSETGLLLECKQCNDVGFAQVGGTGATNNHLPKLGDG